MDWKGIEKFDRFPNLSIGLQNVKDFAEVTFQGEEKEVPAEVIQKSLVEAGKKNIKARDSLVFHVKDSENKDYEIWISKTSYTNLRELAEIRENNKGKFEGAKVKITRISKEDMTQNAFKFEGIN